MLRRALSVVRAPGPRVVSTACGPRSLWTHQPSILVDPRLAIGGSLSETSTSLKVFQLRWKADNNRGGSSRGKRRRGATKRQRAVVDFRSCQGVVQLVDLAHRNLEAMTDRDIADFWSCLPRLLHKRGKQDPNLEEKLGEILGCSLDQIKGFSSRGLAQTSLGLAKTIGSLTKENRRYSREDPRRVLRELLAVNEAQLYIFERVEMAALPILDEFNARHLSNLIYSFGLVKYNPTFNDKKTLFDALASTAIDKLAVFNGQDISNMLLAFVYVGAKNSMLFQKTGEALLGLDFGDCTEQALANILWSFAKSGEASPELFEAIENHIVVRSLDGFRPQHLSNIVWAYATVGVSHPELFKKIGDHVAGLDSLDWFTPQALSNTAWAYATAEASHSELFKKIGNHIAGMGSLDLFNSQDFSNTAWAYATARRFHSRLFEKLSTEAIVKGEYFDGQEVANFLWACATVGYSDERLFSAFTPVIESKLDECNEQHLANIAWAYSVVNVPSQDLFNECYVGALASRENAFSEEDLSQLHQWQLWQQELESRIELPRSLRAKCRNAFTSRGYSESKLQNDVAGELRAAGLDLDEEVLLGSGYRIDALVKVGDGRKVAVEVDGPSHFIDRRPTGSTILKHRQVLRLDRIEVVSVPYWEWNELKNSVTKQHYLNEKLGCDKDH